MHASRKIESPRRGWLDLELLFEFVSELKFRNLN